MDPEDVRIVENAIARGVELGARMAATLPPNPNALPMMPEDLAAHIASQPMFEILYAAPGKPLDEAGAGATLEIAKQVAEQLLYVHTQDRTLTITWKRGFGRWHGNTGGNGSFEILDIDTPTE